MRELRRWMALIALLCSLVGAGSAAAQSAGPVYIVEEGDSLWGVANRFGTTVEALAQANDLNANTGVTPGQSLTIPGYEDVTGRLITYDVGFGEDLSSVAQVFGVDPTSVLALNRGLSPERLYVGQPLIVPYQEGNPRALVEARRVLIENDESLNAYAIASGQNAWSLQARNGGGERLWLLPGDSLAVPAKGVPNKAFFEPLVSAEIDPEVGTQGETVTVRLRTEEPVVADGDLAGWPLVFQAEGARDYVALQGIHAMVEPGIYDLEIRWRSDSATSTIHRFRQPVRLRPGEFGSEALTVNPQTIDPAVTGPEDARIQELVTPKTPEKLWEGTFKFPSEFYTDAFPSTFGTRRSYNGEGYFKYHNGLDFYGGTGVPILAPARGRVVFAGPLDVRGNATYIDHGWGVYTGYLHQSEILVEVGETVEPGQEIGLIGATGRVTGPHLHWEVWVGGIPVDPLKWVGQEFP